MPENSGENSGPELKPGPVGGMLLAGGVPGNKGGPGRPPSAVREKLARVTEKAADWLDAEWELLPNHERLRAMDVAGKYSIGQKVQVQHEASQEVADALRAMVARWYDELDRDLADRLADDVDRALESIAQVQ